MSRPDRATGQKPKPVAAAADAAIEIECDVPSGEADRFRQKNLPAPCKKCGGKGGYRTNVTEAKLKGAPKYSNDNSWNWDDPARARAVNDYYSGF